MTGIRSVNQQLTLEFAFIITAEHAARPAINVDFPAPEAPNSNTRSPGCMVKSTCLNAKSLREACRHPQSRATTPAAENGFLHQYP